MLTSLFPNERAGLIAQGGAQRAGFSGITSELMPMLGEGLIDRALVVAAAPVEFWRRAVRRQGEADVEGRVFAKLAALNEWTCGLVDEEPRITAAIAAEARIDSARMIAEILDKAGRPGVRALKLHPALNLTPPTDPGCWPILEAARDGGLAVVAHGGGSVGTSYESPVDYCAPANFASLLAAFPNFPMVLAHFAHPTWTT